MNEFVNQALSNISYGNVAILMFLENLFPPLPSELIMPLAGFVSARGELSFWGLLLAGILGSAIGQLPLYYLGHVIEEEKLKRLADNGGWWLALSSKDITRAQQWFETHGDITVFIARLVPGVRSLISIPAGISGMPLPQFILYSTLGITMWSTILLTAGYILGEQYHKISDYLAPVSGLIILILVTSYVVRSTQLRKEYYQRKSNRS